MKEDEAFRLLKHSFDSGRPPQACIVAAPPRLGGLSLAERVLQTLYCTGAEPPCGVCRECGQVASRTHVDVLWVEPQKKSRQISVEQIRNLQQRVFQTSFVGGWKVCVLVGADRLGGEAANALLKTLEEPPPQSFFMLLTDSPQLLLPTIISRCQSITLSGQAPEPEQAWQAEVLDLLATSGRAGGRGSTAGVSAIAAFARSDRLVSILQGMKGEIEAEEKGLAAEEAVDEERATIDARVNARYRERRRALLQTLLGWYRDLLFLVSGTDERLVRNRPRLEPLRRVASGLTYRQALRSVETVESMNRRLERNLPEATVLAAGFGRLP